MNQKPDSDEKSMSSQLQSHYELEEELKNIKSILSVAQVVVSSLDLDEVLQNILFSAMSLIDIPAGSIALYDRVRNEVDIHVHFGFSDKFVSKSHWRVKQGGLTHTILNDGKVFVINDTHDAPYFNNPLALNEGIRSLIAIPLKIQDSIIGILYLDDFVPREFAEKKLNLLSVLTSFATMSIDNARMHEQMRLQASTDGLTGLYNHRQFVELFDREMSRSKRFRVPLSLLMIDVDRFKLFNDKYGHPVGDEVLIQVARLIRDTVREVDLSFRYGGEEFIALLPETDLASARPVAERIRRIIEENAVASISVIPDMPVTVSIGVASYPRNGTSCETLLKVVDDLMYQAKSQGRNLVVHSSRK